MSRVAPHITLDAVQEEQLQTWMKAPSTPQNLALRSRIVLAAAGGQSNQQIASNLSLPQITVSKWRRRFASHGLEGLQDAPRSGRPLKHGAEVWQRVQHRVCQQPKFQSRWTVRTLAREMNLPSSTVHGMLVASGLQPHRLRTFTFSPDPDFEAKLLDVTLLKHQIAVKTEHWDVRVPGFTEVDLVSHSGNSARGEFAHSRHRYPHRLDGNARPAGA